MNDLKLEINSNALKLLYYWCLNNTLWLFLLFFFTVLLVLSHSLINHWQNFTCSKCYVILYNYQRWYMYYSQWPTTKITEYHQTMNQQRLMSIFISLPTKHKQFQTPPPTETRVMTDRTFLCACIPSIICHAGL